MRSSAVRNAIRFAMLLLCVAASTVGMAAQGANVVLVLPFDNRSGQQSLDWVGESFAETISARLQSAGFLTINRTDREFALDHLGLPQGFRPSRATSIRIGQTLDAEYIVIGSFTISGSHMAAQAQVLRVNELKMTQPIDDSADLQSLLNLENGLAWKIARNLDPDFSVALDTFLATSRDVKLEAYENYIRGVATQNEDEKLKRFQAAVSLSPDYTDAELALGKELYAQRQYEEASRVLAKIPHTNSSALEASFYLGLAYFNAAKYHDAEQAFAFVASRLPLPEVVNNQGVALARQKRDATPLLQRASIADPQDPDYHFNMAVSLYRRGDKANAKTEVEKALKIRPIDTEADDLLKALTTGRAVAGFDPQERIRRTYSEASLRQAVFQMDQLRALKSASLPPAQRALEDAQAGEEYLAQGFIPEAEREFQSALKADVTCARAHTGLAQVRERTGNLDEAIQQARAAIRMQPSVNAFLVLARVHFQQNQLQDAAHDTANALNLDPKNGAALGMKQALAARGQQLP